MEPRVPVRRGRPRQFSTDAALDRVIPVFWQKGFDGASLADLTAAAGLHPPSLYAAFTSKQALFLAALDRYAATVGPIPALALAAAPDDRKAEAFAAAATDLAFRGTDGIGCLIGCIGVAAAGSSPVIREHVQTLLARSAAALSKAGGPGMPDGHVLLGILHASAARARCGASRAEVIALVLAMLQAAAPAPPADQ
jgi:AcrR family transcriptional regulator